MAYGTEIPGQLTADGAEIPFFAVKVSNLYYLDSLATFCKQTIEREAELDGLEIDDGNVVDLIADNSDATLVDIRQALVLAGYAKRFPKATRGYVDSPDEIRGLIDEIASLKVKLATAELALELTDGDLARLKALVIKLGKILEGKS